MNRTRNYGRLISVVGMIAVLGVAAGLDVLMAFLGRRNAQTFALSYVILWIHVLSFLLLAALLLLLFWFVLNRAPRSTWIAALYVLVGLFFAFFQVVYFSPPIGAWIPHFLSAVVISATSYTILAGSFIAIIGLLMLILPGR